MAQSFSTQYVLARILNLLNKDWVREFLFKSTPESDLKILTSKQQVQYAFSGKMSMSVSNPSPILSMFAHAYTNSEWVIIPAYNIDELSASILLKDNRSELKLPSGMRYSTTSYVRFVRNDANGDCLSVSLDSDLAELTIVFWDSPIHRHNHFMMFPKNVICDEMYSDRPVNVDRLARSVVFYIHFDQFVMCLTCNPFGIRDCACRKRLELYPAKSVLDFSTSSKNMAVNIGSFAGTARTVNTLFSNQVMIPCNGAEVFNGMIGGNDPGVIPRLIAAGISQSMRSSVLSPPRPPGHVEPMPSFAVKDIRIGNELCRASGPRMQGWHEFPTPGNVSAFSNVFAPAGPIGIGKPYMIGNVLHSGTVVRFPNPLPAQVNPFPVTYDTIPNGVAAPVSTQSEQEAKALRRKMRNRETAFRSIRKKKELTEKITKERNKIEKLRQREKTLQEENKLLRNNIQFAADANDLSSLE